MKGAFVFLLLLPCLLPIQLFSQETQDFEYTIASEAFGKERKIYVHVPESYYESPDAQFATVYVLDAQAASFYNNAKGIVDYLVWGYQVMPMIVVGIHSDNRGTEFVPQDRSLAADNEDNTGTAHLLQKHFKEEVIPLVEEKFRVNQLRAIVGHSRGGCFVTHTLFSDQNELFDAYLAISPGLHYINNQVMNDAQQQIQEKRTFKKFYYASVGSVGDLEHFFTPQVQRIDSLWKAHPNPSIHWESKQFEGTTHWTTVAPSLAHGIVAMNRAYQPDLYLIEEFAKNDETSLAAQLETYYAQQKKALGYLFPADYKSLRYFGRKLAEMEKYEKAIELYDLCIAEEPNEIRTYSNKGWAYQELNKPAKAIATYEAALKILGREGAEVAVGDVEKWKTYFNKEINKLKE